jgi:adenine-specific DNA-methyltransferase
MGKDYSALDNKGLLKVIAGLESRKRYGLVWDEESTKEQFEKESENALPVLAEVKKRAVSSDPALPMNVLIEGDNYHVLTVLGYTHKAKIDVIYIDPPYNTGNKTWKYNNDFVDKDDVFRHSKFLSFMNKRVRLAKDLLTEDGIIVCAIDDNECQNMRHLFDDVFGQKNRLSTVVVVSNPGGRQDDEFFATAHEYMLVYAKNASMAKVGYLPTSEKKTAQYKYEDKYGRYKLRDFRRSGIHSRPAERPNLFYSIYVNPDTKDIWTAKKRGYRELLPVDPKGIMRVWRWNAETLIEKAEKYIDVKVNGEGIALSVKEREEDNEGQKPKTIWNESCYSSTVGTEELKNILGNEFNGEKIFDFPKSRFLMQDILQITSKANSIVLDFFAGSGTTGQAVLELNKEDGGNRTFVLCTNNEGGICEDVCYPRIKKVIKGYKLREGVHIDPLGGNLKYFKTAFVPRSLSRDELKIRLTQQCTEMLCLREGIYDSVKTTDEYRIFKQQGRIMAVYYALERDGLTALKADLDAMTGEKTLYCFTLDPLGLDMHDFDDWLDVRLEPIPQKILDAYEEAYEH